MGGQGAGARLQRFRKGRAGPLTGGAGGACGYVDAAHVYLPARPHQPKQMLQKCVQPRARPPPDMKASLPVKVYCWKPAQVLGATSTAPPFGALFWLKVHPVHSRLPWTGKVGKGLGPGRTRWICAEGGGEASADDAFSGHRRHEDDDEDHLWVLPFRSSMRGPGLRRIVKLKG